MVCASATASVNGWSLAILISVPSGSSSHGRLSARTMPKWGARWMPLYSSARMISTTALMLPHQTSAGTRIQSRPRAMA
jgi:hypothetical protein